MIRVDTTTLADLINRCFAFATDARVPRDAQVAFLADGKRLRGLLLNLLSAQFDDGTQAVLEANQEITNVNAQLSNMVAALANIAASLAAVASIVGSLDKLLGVAVAFV
jgi:geranylgeranyl pyrophosphate synthase